MTMADTELQKTTAKTEEPARRLLRPRCSIVGDAERVVLTLEMPGVKKDDLKIDIENNELRISGKRQVPENRRYFIRERLVGDFATTYTLDETIDQERIEAELHDGLLSVTLHVKEAVKPRKITVRAS
jgi:HSP20 family protein